MIVLVSHWFTNAEVWRIVGLYAVPVISVFASYLVGRLQNSLQQRQSVRKERYINFYLPMIKILMRGKYWNVTPYQVHPGIVKNFMPGLEKHLELADAETAEKYYLFLSSLIDYEIDLGIKQEEVESSKIPGNVIDPYVIPKTHKESYNQSFNALVRCILQSGSRLSNKLRYPDLAATILTKYAEQESK